MFAPAKVSTGATWGQDDGVEICIAGQSPDGELVTFVIRGYAGGVVQSVTDAARRQKRRHDWAKRRDSRPSSRSLGARP